MNCFYHQTVPAVGTCKSCGKGLCASCAVDLGKGLACRGRCESDTQALINLIQNNVDRSAMHNQLVDAQRRNRFFSPFFLMATGLFFFGFGLYESVSGQFDAFCIFQFGLGGLFFVFGFVMLLRVLAMTRATKRV